MPGGCPSVEGCLNDLPRLPPINARRSERSDLWNRNRIFAPVRLGEISVYESNRSIISLAHVALVPVVSMHESRSTPPSSKSPSHSIPRTIPTPFVIGIKSLETAAALSKVSHVLGSVELASL